MAIVKLDQRAADQVQSQFDQAMEKVGKTLDYEVREFQ
jgi:hypothetical protein